MNQRENIYAIVNNLNSRLKFLESSLLGTLHEHTHIHTRRERHGEGVRKVEQYMKEFKQFYEKNTSLFPSGFPVRVEYNTPISLILQLSDEDSRYTTDVSPGIYCKEIIFMEYYKWSKMHGEQDINQKILVWDLFCSPGMDILYMMIQDYRTKFENNTSIKQKKRQLEIVGVSKADSHSLSDRFKRMTHNVNSLASFLPEIPMPTLIESTAQDYCRTYRGRAPDIVFLSPPWMETLGEMVHERREVARSAEAITADIVDLTNTIQRNTIQFPKFIVISVPFSWPDFSFILEDLNRIKDSDHYTLCHSIEVVKRTQENHHYTISSYFMFIISESGPVTPTFTEFVYYV
jgi:hypothetical protein